MGGVIYQIKRLSFERLDSNETKNFSKSCRRVEKKGSKFLTDESNFERVKKASRLSIEEYAMKLQLNSRRIIFEVS